MSEKHEVEIGQCPGCLEEYDTEHHRPLLLPGCADTLCSTCVKTHVTKPQKGSSKVVVCPTCEKATKLSTYRLQKGLFQENKAFAHLLQIWRESIAQPENHKLLRTGPRREKRIFRGKKISSMMEEKSNDDEKSSSTFAVVGDDTNMVKNNKTPVASKLTDMALRPVYWVWDVVLEKLFV